MQIINNRTCAQNYSKQNSLINVPSNVLNEDLDYISKYSDIMSEILFRVDLPEIATARILSRKWEIAANQKKQWVRIGNLLQLPFNKCDQEQIKKYILQTKDQVKGILIASQYFYNPFSISENLKDNIYKLFSSAKIENINKLRQILISRDAIVFRKELENSINIQEEFQLPKIESFTTLLTLAEGLSDWCRGYLLELAEIENLDLENTNITSLPPQIGLLKNLKSLWLSHNQLMELPLEIGQLSRLKYLAVNSNRLTELPAEIGQLSMLSFLSVSNNQLTKLPLEIGRLSKLKELGVIHNPLTELPLEIEQLGISTFGLRAGLKINWIKKQITEIWNTVQMLAMMPSEI